MPLPSSVTTSLTMPSYTLSLPVGIGPPETGATVKVKVIGVTEVVCVVDEVTVLERRTVRA